MRNIINMQKALPTILATFFLTQVAHPAPKPAAKKEKTSSYEEKPFDTSIERLSNLYKGHNLYSIAAALLKRPTKDEFETTEKYAARLSAWSKTPFIGNMKPTESIAIRDYFGSLEKEYDADKEIMSFRFDRSKRVSAEDSENPYITVDIQRKTLPTATGKTAMGISFKYERQSFSEFGVKLTNLAFDDEIYKFPVSADIARRSPLWLVLYVGNITSPYFFSEESYHTPSLTERYEQYIKSNGVAMNITEIWIYDFNGTIISKINVSKKQDF